jgi:TolB protein
MRRWTQAIVAALVALPLAACSARTAAGDCGVSGLAPHPEIGGELVYTCFDPVNKSEMFLLDVTTGRVRPLTADHAWTTDPAWSPDGTRIAYVSTKDGQTDIYVMGLADGEITRLTHDGGWNGNPTWSPDGSWIMFDSARDGVNPSPHNNFRNLFLVRPDGTDLRRLTHLPRYNGSPSWGPTGARIAFVSDRDDTFNVFTMTPDGSEERQLTHWHGADVGAGYARWSPDGARLVFGVSGPKQVPPPKLYWISVDGGEPHELTTGGMADWSADGRWIAFHREESDRDQIFVVRPDGTGLTQLTTDRTWKAWARWRPR